MANNSNFHQNAQQLVDELVIINKAKLNPEHFAPLYDKYYKQIFKYIHQRVEDRDTAFDLTSDVFLKALTNLPKYEDRGVPFSSWLYRIAFNETMQMFKNKKDKQVINADISDLRDICEENETPFFEDYIPVIKKLILELKFDELQLVEMRFFEKRPFKEISEILNINEGNAKVKMHRIIEKLKKSILKIKIT